MTALVIVGSYRLDRRHISRMLGCRHIEKMEIAVEVSVSLIYCGVACERAFIFTPK